jgi:hypothetical protein
MIEDGLGGQRRKDVNDGIKERWQAPFMSVKIPS